MDTTPPVAPPRPPVKTSYSSVAGLLIILAAIVIGALYFLQERVGESDEATFSTQGTSTDAHAIESDLDAESPDTFERDIDQAFLEMDAAFEAE